MSVSGPRTRTFSWSDPTALGAARNGRHGLEYLAAVVAGSAPPPPIAEAMGMALVEVDRGRAVFVLEPAEWMYNPIGSVHGGIAATLLDSCMGCAVHTEIEPGVAYTTSDLQVRYIRAMTTDTGPVRAEGTVVHVGRRTAVAEGRLRAERDGRLLAQASSGFTLTR